MSQSIALQVRTPQPNLAAITDAAQRANLNDFKLKNAPAQSELEGLQIQDEIGERTAMGGYRDAVSKGDPNALDKLASQPGLQKQMYEAFDGMSPKEFMAAKKRADRIANAAKYVGAIDPKDIGQNQRWADSAQVLLEEGVIDKGQYNLLIESGPNEFILQQAQTTKQWMDQYGGQKKDDKSPEMKGLEIEKIRAEIEKINRTGADDETSKLKLDLLEAQIGKINAETESKKTGDGKPSQSDKLREKQFEIEMKALLDTRDKALEIAVGPEEIGKAQTEFTSALQGLMKRYGLTDADVAAKMEGAPPGSVGEDATAPSAETDALTQAKEAIARGADRDAVLKRLEENGIDASGL